MNDYTRAVINRAQELQRLEHAAVALRVSSRDVRGWVAAAVAALMSLIPAISAAQIMLH